MKTILIAATAIAAVTASAAPAATLVLDNVYALHGPAMNLQASNFAPQGIGYDPVANELLFMLQGSKVIARANLQGQLVGLHTVPTFNHTTSIASDGTNYYFSDYTSNTAGFDLYSVAKAGGTATAISSETLAYGGTPIDVRDGLLYRTNVSTSYDYANLNQIRVSSLASPDTITSTINFGAGVSIWDFSVDAASDSIFVLGGPTNATLSRYNMQGQLQDSFGVPVANADGMTFANGKLYLYDWKNGNGASTLSVYSVNGLSGAVPEPATWAMMIGGFALAGGAMRRRASITLRAA